MAETRGNPLALLELPRGLTATQLAGGLGLVGPAALSGRIEESFERRLDALPADTRLLLVVASAEPLGDPLLLWRAAGALGIGMTASDAAEADGLLSIGERVTFRHPLVRSAVYRSAPAEQRRAAHTALAAGDRRRHGSGPSRLAPRLRRRRDRTRRSRSSSSARPAGRSRAAGSPPSAAFLERAVALSRRPRAPDRRAIAAAEASLSAGAFETALGMLAAAEAELAGRAAARSRRSAARRGGVLAQSRQRRAAAAAGGGEDARAAGSEARARHLPRRLGRGAVRRRLARRGRPARRLARRARRAAAERSRASRRSAARRLRAAVHRRARRPATPAVQRGGGGVRGRGRHGRGSAALGLARDRRGRHGVGLRHAA